jgi:hypothetical protein
VNRQSGSIEWPHLAEAYDDDETLRELLMLNFYSARAD